MLVRSFITISTLQLLLLLSAPSYLCLTFHAVCTHTNSPGQKMQPTWIDDIRGVDDKSCRATEPLRAMTTGLDMPQSKQFRKWTTRRSKVIDKSQRKQRDYLTKGCLRQTDSFYRTGIRWFKPRWLFRTKSW